MNARSRGCGTLRRKRGVVRVWACVVCPRARRAHAHVQLRVSEMLRSTKLAKVTWSAWNADSLALVASEPVGASPRDRAAAARCGEGVASCARARRAHTHLQLRV